jgi:AraC-like DNA-binding protein
MRKQQLSRSPDQRDASTLYAPVLEILFDELEVLGIPCPATGTVDTPSRFTEEYLRTVQILEEHLAHDDGHPPMTRTDIELMCRCALSAPTLARAMDLLVNFAAIIHPRSGQLSVEKCDGGYRFVHNSLRGSQSLASSLSDITGIFAFKQLFQWLTGGQAVPRTVSIGQLRRNDILPFLHLFNIAVVANGPVYFLEYAQEDMQRPVVVAAGAFEEFFEFFPCAVYTPDGMPLDNQIASLLSAALRQSMPLPGLAQVAASLGIPPSTLRRKLDTQGTSFRAIREQCQYEAATALLAESALGVSDIADAIGFSNAATFRRAFRRWNGASPTDYRQNSGRVARVRA